MGRSFEVDGRPSESSRRVTLEDPLVFVVLVFGTQCCFGLTRCLVLARL
jgi:hypothetical protein